MGSDPVRVLLLDSGVEAAHPDLRPWVVETLGLEGGAGAWRVAPEAPVDSFGHGTAIAGIILSRAPAVRLTSLRILGQDLRAGTERVRFALDWGLEQGFHIVNCSFGSAARQDLGEFKRLVDRAFCANTWIVAASSNLDPGLEEYPGAFPTVFTVTSADLDDPEALVRRPGELTEFAAHGANVRVAWKDGEHRILTGSSFAAPRLTALLARLRAERPGWNACEAKAWLYGRCTAL
ncbi:MAG: S8 family serine peptidase [Holophaga sp.]|jgi:subtilisin family serine protease